ncbi:MarR family transcriptional regulator [Clostridium estertheticum]|uniref:MarR family winged helix-turn-helix transcriptional regulator n=1 Tax=Clostridium estertheticum TaxID=238834 RepID=UPI0013E92771|nr:MarR family transcriptional regulator [Clostridium estertheticum]MBZ9685797.1 MarR family transcriptional regulator [Clostridium estertheticum]
MYHNSEAFNIVMLIKEISSRTMSVISNSLRDSGLTHQQIIVIKLLAHKKEITISEICEEMSLSKGTVSGIVQRLTKVGYVKKEKHEDDKRNTYVTFSEKGIDFANDFLVTINESFDSIFKDCTREELEQMTTNLKNILKKI